MGESVKQIAHQKIESALYNKDLLKILTIQVKGLALVPEKESIEAYWPCTVTYSMDPDIDEHLNNLDEDLDVAIRSIPTAEADIYILECSKGLIRPGLYSRVKFPVEYLGKPVFEK